jgi:hypothetical protein
VLTVSLLMVFLYQIGMMSYFYMNEYYFQAIIVCVVLVASILINIAQIEVLFDPSSINTGNLAENPNILSKYLDRWRYLKPSLPLP